MGHRRQHLLSFVHKLGTGFVRKRGRGLIPLHEHLRNYHLKNAKMLHHLKPNMEKLEEGLEHMKLRGKGTVAHKHEMGGTISHHKKNSHQPQRHITPLKFNY